MTVLNACYNGDLESVKNYIRRKERFNVIDQDFHCTPLQWAVINGHTVIVKLLLDSGIELAFNHKDKEQKTALEYAKNSTQIFDMLIAYDNHLKFPVIEPQVHQRFDCSWRHLRTHFSQVGIKKSVNHHGQVETKPIISETLHLKLEHRSQKTQQAKWSMHVGNIHQQLRNDLGTLQNIDGNMAAVDITFEYKVEGEANPREISFPLKVPGKKVFTITEANESIQKAGNNVNVYQILRPLHQIGRERSGVGTRTHGHPVTYDGSSYDQGYVHHSEQALAAYLTTPDAANMLVTRLRTELRSLDAAPKGARIKIYGVYLHICSDKTSCGPCEFVMVGLQNDRTQDVRTRGQHFGFIEQLEAALLTDNSIYNFYLPTHQRPGKEPGLRCYITFAGKGNDATHRASYKQTVTKWSDREPSILDVSSQQSAHKFFIAQYHSDAMLNQHATSIYDRTFFSSACKTHKATPKKQEKYRRTSENEFEDLNSAFEVLGMKI